jgi:hypothetical protein
MPGQAAVLSNGGALAPDARHGIGPWRLPTLVLGALLACVAALAPAMLLVLTPSGKPLAVERGSHGRTLIPVSLAPAASASIGASDHGFWPVRHGALLLTRGGGIHSTFTALGATLHVSGGTLGLSLAGIGRYGRLDTAPPVTPTVAANEVLYRHGSISGYYRNGPYGLEQGFILERRPAPGTGALVLALHTSGTLIPLQAGAQVLFRTHAGATKLRYGQLRVLDATGRRLPARMQLHNGTLRLIVDDSKATYPIWIDPFIQQGEKLTGSGEDSGKVFFGWSVALSADGDTALIGGVLDNSHVGAAWVFTRSGSTWTQQGEKLTGGGESGDADFGTSVALSADGNTALVGGQEDDGHIGAAWVFTRSGSTWAPQGSKLTGGGESGEGSFGSSVALSAEGNTALIGGPGDSGGEGAAWVFTRSGSTWAPQGSKLTPGGEVESGSFGSSVALSAEGNTALIGGMEDNSGVGAAWVFANPPSVSTGVASAVTQSAATLNATVDPNGSEVSSCTLEYGTTSAYGSSVPCTPAPGSGTSPVAVSASVAGLAAAATYHFRVSAADSSGTGYGSDETFQTPPNPPAAVTGAASTVGEGDATLNATVNPNGGPLSVCRFEYGTSSAYGSSVPCGASGQDGDSPVAVSGAVVGLTADTTYHFRVLASNAGGASDGGDKTFRTLAPRIEAGLTWSFGWTRRYTIVESLTAHSVPKGGYVEISCKGRGCPFARHRSATVASHRSCRGKRCAKRPARQGPTVSLAGLFKGRHLGIGTRISVVILKAGWVGKSFVFTVRNNRTPNVEIASVP